MEHPSKILKIESLNKNVKRFIVEKPKNYNFIPGQHTILAINKQELKEKKRPFSISSSDKDNFLEFIIKIYDERNGITKEFDKLEPEDELIIGEPKGKISYKGKGTFLSAGTGINPFLSIMKSLNEKEKTGNFFKVSQKVSTKERENNFLIYLSRTQKDIILESELKKLFNNNAIFILSREKKSGYEYGHIDKNFLKNKIKNFNQKFYICGPFKLVAELKKILMELGVKEEDIVSEI